MPRLLVKAVEYENNTDSATAPAAATTAAIDDDSSDDDEDDDLDDGFVELQRSLSHKRREEGGSESPIQKMLPFTFAPNIRPLSISDVESCVALENAAFPHKEHRASREKFEYRLTTCPELSLGLYQTVVPSQARSFEIETLEAARPVETERENRAVSVLLAHIVSTRSCSKVVTDGDMDYPRDWKTTAGKAGKRDPGVGDQETGRTVAIHSLAVAPKLQGCGLGKLIVKSYLQQINNSGMADRVALICQEHLVDYYKRFGFRHMGESKATFGGGGWHDMVFELAGPPKIPHM